mmetsp:Transcript_108588/g.306136  ORF Transcript_108588/g.306136 Transcript_108588/m.306136 type:complete len:94 (+) Transcript_108588:382-663(+)
MDCSSRPELTIMPRLVLFRGGMEMLIVPRPVLGSDSMTPRSSGFPESPYKSKEVEGCSRSENDMANMASQCGITSSLQIGGGVLCSTGTAEVS